MASGKTLNLATDLDMAVATGNTLQVNGTVNGQNLTNDGSITVTSSNSLDLAGNLVNNGTLEVTATGRSVTEGTFSGSGTLNLTKGAQVKAKMFDPGVTPPTDWGITGTTDSEGYYHMNYTRYTITFDANGGILTGSNTAVTREDGDGVLDGSLWPEDFNDSAPTRTGYTFAGWFTAEGTQVGTDTRFTGDTTVYAHWTPGPPYTITFDLNGGMTEDKNADPIPIETADDGVLGTKPVNLTKSEETADGLTNAYTLVGWSAEADGTGEQIADADVATHVFTGDTTLYAQWELDTVGGDGWIYKISAKSLRISQYDGESAMADFDISSGDTRPWKDYVDEVEEVQIYENVTKIGAYAFANCPNLTSVVISTGYSSKKTSLETIGANAFDGCESLTTLDISEGVTTIAANAFNGCTSLASIRVPTTMTSITDSAFTGCNNLKTVYYAGDGSAFALIGVVDDSGNTLLVDIQSVFPAQTSGDLTVNYNAIAITFYADGGTFTNGSETMICYTNTGKVTPPDNNPTKTGATFAGWFDSTGQLEYDFTTGTFSEDDTVYAKWTETTA